ncbi:DNA methyltransferase 3 isoform X1 [Osmia lignaria lignaria]|uniref:DNA methyltransferase 3 isoform X1 n=2 Tax=Osmia lignaria lignaria TaxID=1437193 RepID=UPI00402BD16E
MSWCVDQQQVTEETIPVEKESLQRWTERSVWSLVCAMELGLIPSETNAKSVSSFVSLTDDESLVKTSTVSTESFFSINSPIDDASPPLRKTSLRLSATMSSRSSETRSKRGRRKPTKSRNVYANRANNSTMENFWKSCKRKARRSEKREKREDGKETNGDFTFDLLRNDCETCPTCKRKCVGDESSRSARFPVVPNTLSRKRIDRKLRRKSERGFVSKNREKKRNAIVSSLNERFVRGRWTGGGKYRSRCSIEAENHEPSITDGEPELCQLAPIDRKYASEPSFHPSANFHRVFPTFPPIEDTSAENNDRLSIEEEILSDGRKNENGREKKRARPRCQSVDGIGKRNETRTSSLKRNKTAPASVNSGESAINMTLRAITSQNDEEYHELRRVTRGSTKVGKDHFVGKLVWGCCSGWWPALIIGADHVGMLSEAGKLWVYWIEEARISLLNEKTQIESFSCNLKCRLTQNLNVARVRAIDATMQMLRKHLGCALTKPYSVWIEKNFSETIEAFDEIRFYPYPSKIQQRLDQLKEKNAKVTEKYLLDQKRETQGKKIDKPKESAQRLDVDLTRLPLKEQRPGVITWAKILGHNWWPAMIIDYRDCCMREPSFGCQWIMWYGDYQLSEVHHQLFLKFDKGIEKLQDYIKNTKKHVYLVGVLQASKDYCSRMGLETENWTLADVFEYFLKEDPTLETLCVPLKKEDSVKIYDKYSTHIVGKLNELKNNPNVDDKRAEDIKNSDDLRSVISGQTTFESLCLKCLKIPDDGVTEVHPFFEGSLCIECSRQYKPCMFVFGNDSKCFYCTICAATGMVIICDKEDCPRVYCTACMKHLLCPTTYEQVLQEDPWECFLCSSASRSISDTIVRPRSNWKDKIIDMFRTNCNSVMQPVERSEEKRKIRVLSLFDGLSTGLLVLLKLGLVVDVYYASEIDPDALLVSASHFGDRIIHLGDARDITKEKIKEIGPIDLLIGGSPCNDLSLANPARLGLYDPKGTGVLFFEYCRILELVKKINNDRHLFWMYENVASMPSEYRLEINKHLGQEPDAIDSADFSPQHRLRLYWHNLPIEPHCLANQGEQDVQDILTPHCQRYALVKKIRTVTTKVNSLKQGKLALKPILMKDESDSLWITELEEIFGFPRHYTDVKNLSATKRQRLIGKSWSVQTLTAILRSLCSFFQCNTIETN